MIFWLRLALIGAAIGVLFGAGMGYEGMRRDRADAKRAEAIHKANRAAAVAAFTESERRLKEAQNAQDRTDDEKRRLIASRDAARTERERLRDELDAATDRLLAATDAEDPGRTDDTAAVTRDVLGECAERYETVAAEAGRLALGWGGLQRAVVASCPAAVTHRSPESRLDE